MPVIILLDRSLSMWRQISNIDERVRVFDFACKVVATIFDYFKENFQFEFVTLATFSSGVVKMPAGSYEEIRKRLSCYAFGDKSDIVKCIKQFIRGYHYDWSSYQPLNLIIISDGLFSPPNILENPIESILFPFPCRVYWYFLNNYETIQHRIEPLKNFFRDPTHAFEYLYTLENTITSTNVVELATQLCASQFLPFNGMLRFGFKESEISLFPPPSLTLFESNVDFLTNEISKSYRICGNLCQTFPEELNIFGFIHSKDAQFTPCLTRHLILDSKRVSLSCSNSLEKQPVDFQEDLTKQPSLRVILYTSLLRSEKVAVVKLRPDWFAYIFATNDDSKKRSINLVLSVLPPGASNPLLGPMDRIGCIEKPQIPIRDHEFSYSSGTSHIWLKYDTLHTDITKLQRYAKKMTERQSAFLSELNKLKNAAYCYGYYELLDVIRQTLTEEKNSAVDQKSAEFLEYVLKQLETAQPGKEIVSGGFEFSVQAQRHTK
ncbi:hypothetical protein LOD99_4384 [Oopsacas minuta]|uniref:Integrator complex subunit 14 n=1 Tax=Oopsacas minuta TaxID=111878 RepID=A0AAV7JVT2_9METZ|nr:hypothetical protein LOD99_4384 [Oopsacas minuta]